MAPRTAARSPYPLYNTTFTLHRLSPLYTAYNGPPNNEYLKQHARHFRDVLVGDVLRGVRVGLAPDHDILARVGALQEVTWQILRQEEVWDLESETEPGRNDDSQINISASRGILVNITYEKAHYTAILLHARDQHDHDESGLKVSENSDGFRHFPLLLTRMPGPLRETFIEFLSTTFDARVSTLHLGETYLTGALEKYIADVSLGVDDGPTGSAENSRALEMLVKDVLITVGFDLPGDSKSLKSIDIQIAKEDLAGMIARGKKNGRQEEPAQGLEERPFIDALAIYIKKHLALDLRHEMVKIVKIACGGFVLGSEGKVKIMEPLDREDKNSAQAQAAERLVNGLIMAAKGGALSKGIEPP